MKNKIFNSPIEIGLRTLYVLSTLKDFQSDLQRLVYYDYFLIHSGDVENGPKSLHPSTPFRSGEIAVKRELIKKGLQLMHLKGLVEVNFTPKGLFYSATKRGEELVFESNDIYSSKLRKTALWLHKKFELMSDKKLRDFVSSNIQSWGTEFSSYVK